MSRKKRSAKSGSRGSPKGNLQQKIFWVLSFLVALSLVSYFGPVSPQRRRSPPPPPTITATPISTPQPTPTP